MDCGRSSSLPEHGVSRCWQGKPAAHGLLAFVAQRHNLYPRLRRTQQLAIPQLVGNLDLIEVVTSMYIRCVAAAPPCVVIELEAAQRKAHRVGGHLIREGSRWPQVPGLAI